MGLEAWEDLNDFLVVLVELVRAHAVLTQTLAYMADIEKIAEQRKVRGIIIARDFSSKLVSAVSRVQDIELMKYKVKFNFESLTQEKNPEG